MENINILSGDLSDELANKYLASKYIAVDSETLGLNPLRDRLCLIQMCDENGLTTLIKMTDYVTPNLKKVFESEDSFKLFHYARFDVAVIKHYLNTYVKNIYCTKIASKMARTYTDKHSLKHLVSEFLGITLDKTSQTTDWAKKDLSDDQIKYAANDVIYLKDLKDKLDEMLIREKRQDLAKNCFDFLPTLVELDLLGWDEKIFSHHS